MLTTLGVRVLTCCFMFCESICPRKVEFLFYDWLRGIIPRYSGRGLKLNSILKISVRTSQETHYVSATKPNRLMLFGETVAVYCEVITTDSQSASSFWCLAPFVTSDQMLHLFEWQLLSLFFGHPLWREDGSVICGAMTQVQFQVTLRPTVCGQFVLVPGPPMGLITRF
jgi:hypothetical protein